MFGFRASRYEYYCTADQFKTLGIDACCCIRVDISLYLQGRTATVYHENSFPRRLDANETNTLLTKYKARLVKLTEAQFQDLNTKGRADRAKFIEAQQAQEAQPALQGQNAPMAHMAPMAQQALQGQMAHMAQMAPMAQQTLQGQMAHMAHMAPMAQQAQIAPMAHLTKREPKPLQALQQAVLLPDFKLEMGIDMGMDDVGALEFGAMPQMDARRARPPQPRVAATAAAVEIRQRTLFSVRAHNFVLRLGDSVKFKSARAIVRWIGEDETVALQLLDNPNPLNSFSRLARIRGFDGVDLALKSVNELDFGSISNANYFILMRTEPGLPDANIGTLFAYTPYDNNSWNLADLESPAVFDIQSAVHYTYLVQLTQETVFYLFLIGSLPRRLDTIHSGQLSLVSAEPHASLVMVVKELENDPRQIDYSASGVIVQLRNGSVKVQINGKEEWTTIDSVFDIGNPPTWVADSQGNLRANNFTDGDFVKVSLKTTASFGFIKGIVKYPQEPSVTYAVVEGVKELSADVLPPYPRLILPYLRTFVSETDKILVVPLAQVTNAFCDLLMEDVRAEGSDVKRGSLLVRGLGDGGAVDLEYIEIVSGFHFKRAGLTSTEILTSSDVLYLCRIAEPINRWTAYQCGHLKEISPQPREGVFLLISDDVRPSEVDYNDLVFSVSYRDGYVHCTRNGESSKTTIDNIFDISNPPQWIQEAKRNLPRSRFMEEEVVAISDSNPIQLGIVRAAVELPWRKNAYNLALDLINRDPHEFPLNPRGFPRDLQDFTQRIQKLFIPYLRTLVEDPKCCTVLLSLEVTKIKFLLLTEVFFSGNIMHEVGSIFVKLSTNEFVDLESNSKVMGPNFPMEKVKVLRDDYQDVLFLLKVVDKKRRMMAYHCDQLNILRQMLPVVNMCLVGDSVNDRGVMGKVTKLKDGYATFQVQGKDMEVTLDKVFDMASPPAWVSSCEDKLRVSAFDRNSLVEVAGCRRQQIGRLRSVVRLPWEEEDCAVLDLQMADEDRELGVPRCVVPFLRQLGADPQRAAVVPASRLQERSHFASPPPVVSPPDTGGSFFIQVDGDERGALWTQRSGVLQCRDSGEERRADSRSKADLEEVVERMFFTLTKIEDAEDRYDVYLDIADMTSESESRGRRSAPPQGQRGRFFKDDLRGKTSRLIISRLPDEAHKDMIRKCVPDGVQYVLTGEGDFKRCVVIFESEEQCVKAFDQAKGARIGGSKISLRFIADKPYSPCMAVFNLPYSAGERDIRDYLKDMEKIVFPKPGMCIISFTSTDACRVGFKVLSSVQLDGRQLRCEPRPESAINTQSTPGARGGRGGRGRGGCRDRGGWGGRGGRGRAGADYGSGPVERRQSRAPNTDSD